MLNMHRRGYNQNLVTEKDYNRNVDSNYDSKTSPSWITFFAVPPFAFYSAILSSDGLPLLALSSLLLYMGRPTYDSSVLFTNTCLYLATLFQSLLILSHVAPKIKYFGSFDKANIPAVQISAQIKHF
eukprot:TRINITY_DN4310_c1_g1_i2.p1 TRINITY_DN4310_c1_g1~~TRINITY_DN4310_c1_g1_i2.p1  ORF type:complete len:127 (+),score=6.16 TRINITY_DN4310_c1_g1_i2:55-435(+)